MSVIEEEEMEVKTEDRQCDRENDEGFAANLPTLLQGLWRSGAVEKSCNADAEEMDEGDSSYLIVEV